MIRLIDLILAPIWQVMLFHQKLYPNTIIGGVIIGITVIMIGVNKIHNKREADLKNKKETRYERVPVDEEPEEVT